MDYIFYRKWNGSAWESTVEWIDETTDTLNTYQESTDTDTFRGVDSYSSFYHAQGGYIGITYQTKSSSPYIVKFAALQNSIAMLNDTEIKIDYITVISNEEIPELSSLALLFTLIIGTIVVISYGKKSSKKRTS